MKKDITITAEQRDTRGKNEARRLRASGRTPAVVYGIGQEPVAVAVSPADVERILRSSTGHNTIFQLQIDGRTPEPVIIADWQNEPLRDKLLHVDLKRIDLAKHMTVKVPVHVTGEPMGVKIQGGLLEIVTRDVEIDCLPEEIPEQFTVNVTELMIGQSVRANGVPLSGSMKLVSAADQVIAHVVAMRAEETPAVVEAEVEPAAAEPEVIKKGKKEEESVETEAKKKK